MARGTKRVGAVEPRYGGDTQCRRGGHARAGLYGAADQPRRTLSDRAMAFSSLARSAGGSLIARPFRPRPGLGSRPMRAPRQERCLWHPFTQMRGFEREDAPQIESAEGVWLVDGDGRRDLDGAPS